MKRLAWALVPWLLGCGAPEPAVARIPEPSAPSGAVAAPPPAPVVSVFGRWREHWGTPGQTDVTYQDVYQVTQTSDGGVRVEVVEEHPNQTIGGARLQGRTLTFRQRTTFEVTYSLTLQPDGRWMVGTAVTPEKTVAVKWERRE